MSFWDNVKLTGKTLTDPLLGLVSGFLQSGVTGLGTSSVFKSNPQLAAQAGIAAEQGLQKSLQNAGVSTTTATLAKVADPVLYAAEKAEKYVFSPIARGISTLNLVTDQYSPLYDAGKYGEGFQFSDVKDAWNRSEFVSLGQSASKSWLSAFNPIGIAQHLALTQAGIDLKEVDLWDDASIKKHFVDNPAGRWITGGTDFLGKNIAIAKAFTGAGALIKMGAMKAGLSTKIAVDDINAMVNYEKLADSHINFLKTNGADPMFSKTVFGQDIQDLAESDNIINIKRILFDKRYSLNPRLPNLIRETKDPEFVRDLLLADKGYGPALERLSSAGRKDDLWYLGDGSKIIQGYFIENGKLPTYTTEQRARWSSAFDEAIAREPKQQEVYDAFLKEIKNPETGILATEPRFFGSGNKAIEPVIGKKAFIAARSRLGEIKTARLERDFSQIGGMTQTILGGNIIGKPVTVLMRWFGTSMPKGIVTHSGLRPLDGIDELMAVFDDVPLFTRGDKLVTTPTGQMTVSQYRRNIIDEFVSATTDGERELVVKNANKSLAITVARSRDFNDINLLDQWVEDLMTNVNSVHGDLRNFGYSMDPTGVRINVNPMTQKQLANSTAMLPIGELDRMIIKQARLNQKQTLGSSQNKIEDMGAAARSVFELGNKAFSFAQLYKFAYIPKNAVFEPILSATIANGLEFTRALSGAVSTKVIQNSANMVMRNIEKSKTLFPSAKKEIQKEVKALSEQYNKAINNRDEVFAEYQQHFSDTPGVSPATKRDWADEVKEDLRAAERVVDELEQAMNTYTIEYGAKPISSDVPSLYNLQKRIQTLKNVEKSKKTKLFPNIKEYKDGGTGGLPGTGSVVGFVNSKYLAQMPGNPVDAKLVNSYREIYRSGKLEEPLMVIYDNETGFAYLGEGNHRLQAALAENIPYVPVRIVRGTQREMENRIAKNKPVLQVKNNKTLPFTTGGPKGPVEYMPPEIHPSFVFDKKFIVKKDEFSQSTLAARFGSEISKAELVLQQAIGDINTLAPELGAMNIRIAQAYDEIGEALKNAGPKLKEKADIFSVSDGRYQKKPAMPDMVTRVLPNGQKITFPSFANQNYLGDGYVSEISQNSTRTIEFLGNQAIAGRVTSISRKGPSKITNTADPAFFGELTYVVNNYMRGDILIDRILAGQSRSELLQWASTRQGRSYARNMGRPANDINQIVDDGITYVNRHLPTDEAKALAAAGPVKETDLGKLLSDKLDQMIPIHPLEVPYANPTSLTKNINQHVDIATSRAWSWLGRPENFIRQVWGGVEHSNRTADKLALLVSQGQEVSLTTALSVRQAAAAEVVDELNKVFYTIPRQQRGLYIARILTTFPNAAASGIHRYGGFAIKKPKRTAMFLNDYYSYYNSFGVDKFGNPVENPMDAEYLLVPGTKEMGFNKGKGMMFSVRATNFIANLPGASWLVPIALGQLFSMKPNSEDEFKKVHDSTIGKIPGYDYDKMFPYGINPSTKSQIANTFTPAWARNAVTAFSASKTNEMWMDSWVSESNAQTILYEQGLGPKPTDKSILNGTKEIYLKKFRTQFFSLLGSPQFVESRPDKIYNDYYNILLDKYRGKVNPATGKNYSSTEITKLAEQDFQKQISLAGGGKFPMDRLFINSKETSPYITPSQKAYNRVWDEFSDIAKELEKINPSIVGLMTADLPKEYSPQINKFLNDPNATLPGGTKLNSQLKTPQMVETELEKSRVWKAYSTYKQQLNDAAVKAGYVSYLSVPELKDNLKKYAEDSLRPISEAWWGEFKPSTGGADNAWLNAYGLQKLVTNEKWMSKFGNTQFWTHAKAFIEYRDSYAKAYKDTPRGSKGYVQDQWSLYLEGSLDLWDPVLQKIINRYFQNDKLKETK